MQKMNEHKDAFIPTPPVGFPPWEENQPELTLEVALNNFLEIARTDGSETERSQQAVQIYLGLLKEQSNNQPDGEQWYLDRVADCYFDAMRINSAYSDLAEEAFLDSEKVPK